MNKKCLFVVVSAEVSILVQLVISSSCSKKLQDNLHKLQTQSQGSQMWIADHYCPLGPELAKWEEMRLQTYIKGWNPGGYQYSYMYNNPGVLLDSCSCLTITGACNGDMAAQQFQWHFAGYSVHPTLHHLFTIFPFNCFQIDLLLFLPFFNRQAHTLTVLIGMLCVLVYVALFESAPFDSQYNTKRFVTLDRENHSNAKKPFKSLRLILVKPFKYKSHSSI